MLLSQLIYKEILYREKARGICLGVGVSLKNYALKYLLCRSGADPCWASADLYVQASALAVLSNASLSLRSFRPVAPKPHAKLFIGKPVYTQNGESLGRLKDVEFFNLTATRLITEKGSFPIRTIYAVSDAIILRKEPPFPLGQRIPAPMLSDFQQKNEPVVTKSVLRNAIARSSLIRLTLSLPPFEQATGKDEAQN